MKKKICFFIPSLCGGGAERVTVNVANKLSQYYDVSIITLEQGKAYNLASEVKYYEITKLHGKSNKLWKILYAPYQYLQLNNILNNFDIIIGVMERACFYLGLSTVKCIKIFNFQNYTSNHLYKEQLSFPFKQIRNFLYGKLLLQKLSRKIHKIVIISQQAKYDLMENFNIPSHHIKVIYNSINISHIKDIYKEDLGKYSFLSQYPYFVNAGRLTIQKGQWHLIRIFPFLKKKYPELKLVFLGEGNLLNYFIKLCKDLNLKYYLPSKPLNEHYDVYFLGFQKNPFKFIHRALAFVFPSLWEGLPLALAEATVCKVPILASDCLSGPREILSPNSDLHKQTTKLELGEYGILLPVMESEFWNAKHPLSKSEKEWLKGLELILTDANLRKKYQSIAINASERFSVDKTISQWQTLIEDLTN